MHFSSLAINILGSSASRFIVSNYSKLPKPQALKFNGIDMAINGLVSYLFDTFKKKHPTYSCLPFIPGNTELLMLIFASRFISLLATSIIADETGCKIGTNTAIILNIAACIIGLIGEAIFNDYWIKNDLVLT